MSVIPEDEADVVSEVFAGHPMPLFDDAEMYINPTAEHSDSLTVNEIQSFPDVDSTNPGSMLFRQIKLFASLKVLVQSVQGLASMPYQDAQQPEAESDFTLQTRNPKVKKSNKALILNICPSKNKKKV